MFAAATVFAYGCSDNFDDSALWKDIDGMYKSLNELKAQVTTMQQQLDALAAVVSGGAVTSITQDADGHYVLSYKDADNVEHTIDIATMDDANTQPIIGMKADGEIYYWTVTTGGKTSRPITSRAGTSSLWTWRCRGWTASARRKRYGPWTGTPCWCS